MYLWSCINQIGYGKTNRTYDMMFTSFYVRCFGHPKFETCGFCPQLWSFFSEMSGNPDNDHTFIGGSFDFNGVLNLNIFRNFFILFDGHFYWSFEKQTLKKVLFWHFWNFSLKFSMEISFKGLSVFVAKRVSFKLIMFSVDKKICFSSAWTYWHSIWPFDTWWLAFVRII